MITRKDIHFESQNWEGDTRITACLRLIAHVVVSRFAIYRGNSKTVFEEVEARCVQEIQHKLYGDAQKLLSELEYTALSSCPSYDAATKLKEGFAKLRTLLTIQ